MGKAAENKQIKLEALFKSAYDLFLSQGIAKTSIHDIVQNAGVAKGQLTVLMPVGTQAESQLMEIPVTEEQEETGE